MTFGNREKKDLIFAGFMGMIDPPREEVKAAIEECKRAGIKSVMITGDHKLTALAIGKELGFKGNCLTGEELEKIDLESRLILCLVHILSYHVFLVYD